jgi:hypothetical protein
VKEEAVETVAMEHGGGGGGDGAGGEGGRRLMRASKIPGFKHLQIAPF